MKERDSLFTRERALNNHVVISDASPRQIKSMPECD